MSIMLMTLSLLVDAPISHVADPGSLDELAFCLEATPSDVRAVCLERAARKLIAASHRQPVAESAPERFGMPKRQSTPATRKMVPSLPRIEQLQGAVATVAPAPAGQWLFVLKDGSRWITQESGLSAPPYAGQTLIIKRAALGSYRAIFHRERPIQVRRLG